MTNWTPEQWAAFAVSFAAIATGGLLLLALAHRLMTPSTPQPLRPARRHPTGAELAAFRRNWLAARNAPARTLVLDPAPVTALIVADAGVTVLGDDLDAETVAHLLPGEGSVTTLAAIADDPGLMSDRERRTASWRWVHADDDAIRGALDAFESAATAAVDAAIERILGGLSGADLLDAWRIDTPTGEYPIVLPTERQQYAVAHALLVS